jgi:hypothetical protein
MKTPRHDSSDAVGPATLGAIGCMPEFSKALWKELTARAVLPSRVSIPAAWQIVPVTDRRCPVGCPNVAFAPKPPKESPTACLINGNGTSTLPPSPHAVLTHPAPECPRGPKACHNSPGGGDQLYWR